jgi:hypothetical protein
LVYRTYSLIAAAILLFIFVPTSALADGSIFSANGVGEEIVTGGSRAQGLGGGAFALKDSISFNLRNPALAAFCNRTIFSASGEVTFWNTAASGQTSADAQFIWKDFALFFPATKFWRIGLGAQPALRAGVRTFSDETAQYDDTTRVHYRETDDWNGSAVDLQLHNAFLLNSRLAAGVTLSYTVQRNTRTRLLTLDNIGSGSYYLDTQYSESETFRALAPEFGLYGDVGRGFGVGVAYRPQVIGRWDYSFSKSGSDSTLTRSRTNHRPAELRIGASFAAKPRLVLVADARTEWWSRGDLGLIADPNGTIQPENPLFLSVGIERLAGRPLMTAGFHTWGLRAGAYLRQHYWPLHNNTAVQDIGATVGISAPIMGSQDWIHWAGEFGLRGQDEKKLGAKEWYIRTSVQIVIAESWFEKTRPRIPK